MGFFTKLFGLGWLVARDVEKSLASDTVSDELEMERKLPNTDISNLPFWNKFFDVDLKKSPDELWIETEKSFNGEREVRTFKQELYAHPYFKTVEAHVVGNNATNYSFRGKYSKISAIDIYFLIESELMQRKNLTAPQAAHEIRGRFDTVYQCIRWQNDRFYLDLNRDIETGDIELLVMTPFYNHEYLDDCMEEEQKQNEDVDDYASGDASEDNDMKPFMNLHLKVHEYDGFYPLIGWHIEQLKNGENPVYAFEIEDGMIDVYNSERENLYSFECAEITDNIDDWAVGAIITNMEAEAEDYIDVYIDFYKLLD